MDGLRCNTDAECKESYLQGYAVVTAAREQALIDAEKKSSDSGLEQGDILIILISSLVTLAILLFIFWKSKCCTVHPCPVAKNEVNPRDVHYAKVRLAR